MSAPQLLLHMPAPVAPVGHIEETIRGFEAERVSAYARRDATTLARLLPPDFRYTNALGKALVKAELLAALASGELSFATYERAVTVVSSYGNWAAAVGYDAVRGQYQCRDISGRYAFRNSYVRRPAGWQIVAAHATRLGC